MATPILNIPEIPNGVVNTYLLANAAFRSLESAFTNFLAVDLSGANVSLSAADFLSYAFFKSTGNATSRTLTVPNLVRVFGVANSGSVALSIVRGTSSLSLPAGAAAWLFTDGTANGLFSVSASSGGGGLTFFQEARSTASPNNLIPAISLLLQDAASDADLVLVPKGEGAFCLAVPTGTAAGGSKRGKRAVDLQLSRSNAALVASGDYSFAAGSSCRASANFSIAMGNGCDVTVASGVAIGSSSTVSGGTHGVAIGLACSVTNTNGICIGSNSAVSGQDGVALGYGNAASGQSSVALGRGSNTRGLYGRYSFASNFFSTSGDAQVGGMVLRNATSTAAPAVLNSTGTNGSATNQLILPNSSAVGVRGRVVARENATGDCGAWRFECLISRGANAAATVLVGSASVTAIASALGASGWVVSVTADTVSGGLAVAVTGEAGKSIKWVCELESVEVAG